MTEADSRRRRGESFNLSLLSTQNAKELRANLARAQNLLLKSVGKNQLGEQELVEQS